MHTYTIDKDALTVNLMRSVGIDKHQARECADVVLQMLAAPSTSPEAIYQYQLANGNWIDQSKEMYDHIVKRGGATVRAVYLSAPSTSPTDAEMLAAFNSCEKVIDGLHSVFQLAAPSTNPDAQDAARYRWLRDSESIVSPGVDLAYDAHRAAKLGNPKIIDAAIDDAIKGGA